MNSTAPEIYHVLLQYDKILLTAHVSPDGDAVGSMIALYQWLRCHGREAVMVMDDDIGEAFSFLDGAERIRRPEEAAETDASWLSVVLDCTGLSRIGRTAELVRGKTLNIDHHVSNEHFADWEYVFPERAAACEILADLFAEWQTEMSPLIANPLYMGIATDCGFFKFSNTKGHTLRAAAWLVDAGAQPHVISEHLDMRSLETMQALSEVLKHIELMADGKIAMIAYTPELLQITGDHTGMYIDYARNIRGVETACTVKYVSPAETRVSLRSRTVDVNAVAAVFGGGGHIRAAGCTIALPLAQARNVLIQELLKVI